LIRQQSIPANYQASDHRQLEHLAEVQDRVRLEAAIQDLPLISRENRRSLMRILAGVALLSVERRATAQKAKSFTIAYLALLAATTSRRSHGAPARPDSPSDHIHLSWDRIWLTDFIL
jgi:hypothetical protein